jgi:hypothetical protein
LFQNAAELSKCDKNENSSHESFPPWLVGDLVKGGRADRSRRLLAAIRRCRAREHHQPQRRKEAARENEQQEIVISISLGVLQLRDGRNGISHRSLQA